MPLRLSLEEELLGADAVEHGIGDTTKETVESNEAVVRGVDSICGSLRRRPTIARYRGAFGAKHTDSATSVLGKLTMQLSFPVGTQGETSTKNGTAKQKDKNRMDCSTIHTTKNGKKNTQPFFIDIPTSSQAIESQQQPTKSKQNMNPLKDHLEIMQFKNDYTSEYSTEESFCL